MPKLRMGLIGGGPGSFIGRVHRTAAELDAEIELVCGAFSSDPEKSQQAGRTMYLKPCRVYDNYVDMIEKEARLPDEERMEFVAIATPNHLHCEPALTALQRGFHVVLEKPMCYSVAEAESLRKAVQESGLVLAVTYTYAGYPMVKEARDLLNSGQLGAVRKVYVEYPQGWLSTDIENHGQKQASWRTDPLQSGAGGAIGDIGTHAAHLAEYVSGLRIEKICAVLNKVVPGRQLDDDAAMLLHFEGGASGVLMASQVAAGEENNLMIRVYGASGGVEWRQVEPNTLVVKSLEKAAEIRRTGWSYLSGPAMKNSRTPAGHPEGYIEAFGNIYAAFARAVRDHSQGKRPNPVEYDFPGVLDGVRGMKFIDAAIRSAKSNDKWTYMQ